jgi:hypothetical protein
MKRVWVYGPVTPKNTKKSDLGFPSIVGKCLPGDEPEVEILAHGQFETKSGAVIGGVLAKVTPPDHSKN